MTTCPRCSHPLPAVRKPTSWRQMLWGGWSCQNCGAELDARRQLIGGRIDSPGGIVVALQPPARRWNRRLILLGGCAAPGLAVLSLLLLPLVGEWALFTGAAVMVVLMALGMIGVARDLGRAGSLSAVLTDAAIRWGDQEVRPVDITAVRREGRSVCIEAGGQTYRLTPLGDPDPLCSAIEEVRGIARDVGSAADVPDTLRRVQGTKLTNPH